MEEKKSMTIEQLLEAMTTEMGRSPETMVSAKKKSSKHLSLPVL